jgi:serine/threonine protein phosphatase 1
MSTEKFGHLHLAHRVWAVAAIHGDVDRLMRLHDALDARFEHGDRIVYLGNFMGRGARVGDTIDELLAFRRHLLARPGMEADDIIFLRGAQEEMWRKLMEIQFARDPRDVFAWMLKEGVGATLAAYGGDIERAPAILREGTLNIARWTMALRSAMRARPGHDELFGELRRAAVTDGGELLLVSAGVDPTRPLEEQGDSFWWGSGYFDRLDERYGGFRLVVRGFDRARQPASVGKVTASIDGGCGFGGTLNAACFTLAGETADWIEI